MLMMRGRARRALECQKCQPGVRIALPDGAQHRAGQDDTAQAEEFHHHNATRVFWNRALARPKRAPQHGEHAKPGAQRQTYPEIDRLHTIHWQRCASHQSLPSLQTKRMCVFVLK
jgi:hypothetical protein